VDPDLWNEHYARYLFAARLARNRRVLDLGCGAGYGSRLLAASAQWVVSLDSAAEALELAGGGARMHRVRAGAAALPLAEDSFDLVVAFEVIEHLTDWREMLGEVRRVLAPRGQFLVSTPNVTYYAQSRAQSGPNPFHAHEFSLEEFRESLRAAFPHVSLFTQNHAGSVVFRPVESPSGFTETSIEEQSPDPEQAHFFLAVCAASPQTGAPTFVYVPSAANVLKEREDHIRRLEEELATKTGWLAEARASHAELVDQFRRQTQELEKSNRWADEMDAARQAALARTAEVQDELAAEQRRGAAVVAAYERRMAEIERVSAETAEWAKKREGELQAKIGEIQAAFGKRSEELEAKGRELAEAVRLLDQAEATVIERTEWAQGLAARVAELEGVVDAHRMSRWVRLGKSLGLGPKS
jgi:SAM-dependent methyltransferase